MCLNCGSTSATGIAGERASMLAMAGLLLIGFGVFEKKYTSSPIKRKD